MVEPLAAVVRERFQAKYAREPDWIIQAPGRVNLIGEHTDTTGGWVFPAAIDRHIVIAAGLACHEFEFESLQAGEFRSQNITESVPGWAKYALGMGCLVQEELGFDLPYVRAVLTSDMPVGSGISSSAALSVASGYLWLAAAARRLEPILIAKMAQRTEWKYAGVKCGLMDPLASACGVAGHALLVDTQAETWDAIPIPSELTIVLCHSGQQRSLDNSEYNVRRAECAEAERLLGKRLRNMSIQEVESANLPDPIGRRARHVVTENARCREFGDAMLRNDFGQMAHLMDLSHESLRLDFEVSTPALDAMVRAGQHSPGCVGIRLTGAGFGGACVALVNSLDAELFVECARQAYVQNSEYFPKFEVSAAVSGAGISSGV